VLRALRDEHDQLFLHVFFCLRQLCYFPLLCGLATKSLRLRVSCFQCS